MTESTTNDTRDLGDKVSVDHLMIATMQRIQPLLEMGVSRTRLAQEVSASLEKLSLQRCSVWRFEADVAHPLYEFDRHSSAAENTSQPLLRKEAEWLFRCAEQALITKIVEAERTLYAVPVSSVTGGKSPSCLMLVEQGSASRMTLDQHADDTLRFMGNVLCTLFCYACE